MSKANYAQTLPPMVRPIKSTTHSVTTGAAVDVTLNTTGVNFIEVVAISFGVYMRWALTVSTADDNWDEFIPVGVPRQYCLPVTANISPTAVSFIAEGGTTNVHLIQKITK